MDFFLLVKMTLSTKLKIKKIKLFKHLKKYNDEIG